MADSQNNPKKDTARRIGPPRAAESSTEAAHAGRRQPWRFARFAAGRLVICGTPSRLPWGEHSLGAQSSGSSYRIWAFAFGYFACYVPYSALTKALSSGMLPGMPRGIAGFELLPLTSVASLCGMFVFISALRWWRFAGTKRVLGINVPMPGAWTFLSGVCTAGIIATTTLAYTFEGVSIVFMMLLMRGGVLAIAPLVDFASRRRVQWYSWVALSLSLGALLVAFFGGSRSGTAMTAVAVVDVLI